MTSSAGPSITVSPGRALILVENLSVPFDRRVWQESRALRDAGYDVSVICPQGTKQDREPYALIDGVEIHRYPLSAATGGAPGYLREYSAALWHSWRIARRLGEFDVVHICNPPDLLFAVALPLKRRGARVIFDQHDLVPELYLSRFGGGKGLLYRAVVALERLTYRAADVVMATNGSYRRIALERGGKAPEDVFVVRSAPDLSRFAGGVADPALKKGKDHLLCYLGVMGPQDGVDYALRSLAALQDIRTDDWHAAFVGAGDCFEEMRALASTLGLDDDVTFTGRIPDDQLLSYLSTADLGLSPDPHNPLNDVSTMNKVMEYMACGLPIVSFDLREARVSAGDAARYVACNDTDAFAAAASDLLDDPVERAGMGAVGRDRVAGELSWDCSKRQLLAAYARALRADASFAVLRHGAADELEVLDPDGVLARGQRDVGRVRVR
jgi:glycosyltransferase involved in cell wall biosynthesis